MLLEVYTCAPDVYLACVHPLRRNAYGRVVGYHLDQVRRMLVAYGEVHSTHMSVPHEAKKTGHRLLVTCTNEELVALCREGEAV